MKKFYITTSIPYVNANPHIGHALEFVQADVLARYHRAKKEDVFFLTGADENSLKNVQAAEEQGISTRELVDANTSKFIELTRALNISNDEFIRTVEERHFLGAQKLWSLCKKEDIYKKKYKGLYCVGCEQFYTQKELVDGKCPEHSNSLEEVEEENYFFKLSNYQKELEKIISSNEYEIVPETKKNEVVSFIKMGLEDFSISRSKKRAKDWGVPVPGDSQQIMYVWFDALANYLTALDFGGDEKKFKKYWPADIHVVGKGIIRFHAVYWTAMLLSAGIKLPKKLFVHGYITIDGAKMSKSLGNVIDPNEFAKKYGTDPVRYYLLRYIHPVQDSDFSIKKFEDAYTADLANGLGNLVSRVAGLIEQNNITIKQKINKTKNQDLHIVSPSRGGEDRGGRSKEIEKYLNKFQFDQALKFIWEKITELDVYVSHNEPWALAKQGKIKEFTEVLEKSAHGIFEVAKLLEVFLPETSKNIQKIFLQEKIKKGAPLFPKIN